LLPAYVYVLAHPAPGDKQFELGGGEVAVVNGGRES